MTNKSIVSCDIGQRRDYSTISIIEVKENGELHLKYIKRLKLKTKYPQIAKKILNVCRQLEDYVLVIDRGGVGLPLVDLLTEAGEEVVGIQLTGGNSTHDDDLGMTIPKDQLINQLIVSMEQKLLKIPSNLPHKEALITELQAFSSHAKASGHISMDARSGFKDDLVLSVAMGVYYAMTELDNEVETASPIVVGRRPKSFNSEPTGGISNPSIYHDKNGRLVRDSNPF